ncbi:AbiV family abortive infection protein [Streptomyces sp. NPDC060085]|uniref:AbiV family abortive infection protein n=1 Tax=Streptomyces sp. NPDC060085 TaxID=3347054 RepID=UPI00364A64CF
MAKLPTDPHLMERTVIDLAAAAFQNARVLLTSAQAVLEAQQWPPAFAFGALALEEVGKGALCMMTLAMPPGVREEFRPDFQKAFTSHQAKAEFAHLVLEMVADSVSSSLEQLLDDVVASARRTNAVKFRGLYVDYTDTGALLQPNDVGESDARWMLATVARALAESRFAEAAVAEPDVFLDFLHRWQDDLDVDDLNEYVSKDPDQFLAQVRAFVRDDVSLPMPILGPRLAKQLAAIDTPEN